MTTIKLKEKSFKFKYLTKAINKDIEKKYPEAEEKYGAMDWYSVNNETISSCVMEHKSVNSDTKYYTPMVTAWDSLKENDDVAVVELDYQISDMATAYGYAREMEKYIKYLLLKEGIERLIGEIDSINNLKRIINE